MRITFDPAKREKHGDSVVWILLMLRSCFRERPWRSKTRGKTMVKPASFGLLAGRMVVVGYTPRGADRHVFSMRKANDREKARIAPLLAV